MKTHTGISLFDINPKYIKYVSYTSGASKSYLVFSRKGENRPSFILASSLDDSSEVTTESSSKEGTLESTEDVSTGGGSRSLTIHVTVKHKDVSTGVDHKVYLYM